MPTIAASSLSVVGMLLSPSAAARRATVPVTWLPQELLPGDLDLDDARRLVLRLHRAAQLHRVARQVRRAELDRDAAAAPRRARPSR